MRTRISEEVRRQVRLQADERCGYCLSSQKYVFGPLEIDHIVPIARGGTDDEENLWLACRMCNGFKGTQKYARDPVTKRRVRIFNPRRQRWSRHFRWCDDGTRIMVHSLPIEMEAQQIHLTGVRMVLYNTNAPSEAERMETVTLSNDYQTGEISWAV
jgi:hypothetical protein